MDSPSLNMYDTYKEEIWKELGPLDPDWFEALTALTNEGNVSDPDDLCANQEGHFKTLFDKTAADSQLFSTPKVFRHSGVVSPETEHEPSFTAEEEKEALPWTATQSPCLFRTSKEGVPGETFGRFQPPSEDSFDLHPSPQKSPLSYAKHISESLGAQIHADMSWTSSLNTPPAVPSTLILSKADDSPCPVSVSEDKNVVFVRKLFPSLSNTSRVEVVSPKTKDMPTVHQAGAGSLEAGQNPESPVSPQSSPNHSDGVWKQKLPDAIKDGDVRSTVASVLDGAENVLSIFFTNSSSALRKVKTDRIKRKQITATSCSSVDVSSTHTADQEAERQTEKTGDVEITQWSPLSLSDIPASCHDSVPLTEQLQSDSDSGQLMKTPLKLTGSGFTKKKRSFVYTVRTPKPHIQGKETQQQSQRMDSAAGIPDSGQEVNVKAPDEADCCSLKKKDVQKQAEEILHPSLQARVQDLDMSQLCRDFAQDFSQMSDPAKLSKITQDTPRNGFSPSACLSAMKQAKHNAVKENLQRDFDGVSNRKQVSATNQSNIEGTISDSGFQSAVTDLTASSFVLPSSEINYESQQRAGFKIDPFTSTNKRNGDARLGDNLQEDETDAKLTSAIKEGQMQDPELHIERPTAQLPSSVKGAVSNISCIPLNGHGSLTEETAAPHPSVHASGFKTASNKGIHVSSANLKRAKRLFEEAEGEMTLTDQPSISGSVKHPKTDSNTPSSSAKIVDISCQLTASQKADVTELCTLLEEADSQFEFTQFKTAKLKQQDNAVSPQNVDKELDPDFLSGIDFDDSFSSEAEKHLAVSDSKTNCESKSTGLSSSSAGKNTNSSSKHVTEGSSSKNLDRAGHTEASKLEIKNPLMLGVGFKTAGGNILRVSKKCLSKARALFADLEENPATSQKAANERSSKTEAEPQCKGDEDATKNSKISGFQMASGKGISVSAKALQEADAFFRDCEVIDSNAGVLEKCETSKEPFHGSVSQKENFQTCKNVQGMKVNISDEPINESENVNTGAAAEVVQDNEEIHSFGFKSTTAAKALSSPSCTSKSSGGFCTAGGKKVSVSAEALKKAECLLNEIHTPEDANKPLKHITKTRHLTNQNGFQTASGKGVVVSPAALKKAKLLLSECKEVEDEIGIKPTHSKISLPGPVPSRSGFFAASGKPVAFSSEALQKAKALFSDISFSADVPAASKTRKQDDSGFTIADGAKVHVSKENLLKAKKLLKESDDGSMQETDVGKKKNPSDFNQNQRMTTKICEDLGSGRAEFENLNVGHEKMHPDEVKIHKGVSKNTPDCTKAASFHRNPSLSSPLCTTSKTFGSSASISGGFCTASGKKVSVSDEAMAKAKSLLMESECEGVEEEISVKPTHSKMSLPGPAPKKGGKPVAFSSEALQKAKALFSDISFSADVPAASETRNRDKKQDNDGNKSSSGGGFYTASGKKVSVSDEAMAKAKSLLMEREFEQVEEEISVKSTHSKISHPDPAPRTSGFLAASGKPVAFSSEALQKAKALFSDISFSADVPAASETRNRDTKQDNDGDKLSNSGGFCAASGNKVSEDTNKDTFPPQSGGFQTASGRGVTVSSAALKRARTLLRECEEVEDEIRVKPTHFKTPGPGPAPGTSGFLAASGKPVAFSSEALQKAKTLFSDISFSADVPAENTEKMHSGFTTAGGAKVHVSQENLLKAKSFLAGIDDGECCDLNAHSASPHDTKKSDLSEVEGVERSSIDRGNETFGRGCKDGETTEASKVKEGREETSNLLDDKINQESSSEQSSALNFQSFNLSGCTKTQQEFFAQEALDCTKALLEDESLAGQSLSMTLESVPQKDNPTSSFRSVEEQKGTGKRSAEDPDVTGQPPLKRRLLEEFDRTVDGSKGSTLHPEKSCPNGVMNDRRVFKYSASLHPNITGPNTNGKNFVDSRLQRTTPTQHSRPEHHKTPAFVPPFLKNIKTESRSNAALKENTRTPSAFVPPFKKQRTIVQESGSKPQEQADKHLQVFLTPCKSNTTEKTQSTADVTGSKSKQDTTKDDLISGSKSEESHVEESSSSSQDVLQNLQNVELARDMQDMRIRKKKRQTIRPLPGSLFLNKTSGVTRIPLKTAVNGKPPARYTQKQLYGRGVHQHVCEITGETAESFRFSLRQFIKLEALIEAGGVQLADGGWLIPRKDGTAGKEEFHRALCDTPGVDPKLISEGWVYNHYRWVVWKQACMERSFPETMGSVCLTPEQVLLQLKYRYDVEVDHSRRPALRKIMEKDDTAVKTLVLCVCGVVSRGQPSNRQSVSDSKTPHGAEGKLENPSAVVWLTDGWYAIKAQLDEPLTVMLHKGRVAVGGKLIVHGAQLLGAQDACSPLEAPESLMLKICANSSRPARWDVKLGFHRDPRPFLLPVSSLYSSGGPVGCVDVVLLRSYPIQWMERKPDGGVVFRSVRAEEKEARRYNSHKQKAMEILFAKIQAEFEKEEKGNNKPQRRRRTVSRQGVASLQDGEELYEAAGDDPAYLEAHLSEQQLQTLQDYRRSLMEKKQAELQDRYRRALENAEDGEGSCPKRDVTPVWRLCFTDATEQRSTVYQLNLWRPSSDLQSLLKEGCRYKVYNLTASDGKKHGGSPTVQLTGTKKTQFQDLQVSQEWLSTRFQPRVSTHFVDLQNSDFQPLCGEVDLTGCVISVVDGQGFSPAFYLTDGKQNFVKVRCFGSFAQSGLEDLVKPRVLLALSNLQLRGQSTAPTPVVFAGDLTVFSTNPKESHLQESLSQLRLLLQSQENFFTAADEHLSHLLKSDGLRSVSSPALQTRTPVSTSDRRQDMRTNVTCQQPIRSLGSFTPINRKPPATAANGSTERDPSSLKRRRALDYLSRIPSPPPLAPLGSAASPCVKKTFNPPRRSATPSTLKTVQTVKAVSSPVEDEWVNDEELAMIDTQALRVGELL